MKRNSTDRWAILLAIGLLAILWFLYGKRWGAATPVAPAIDPTPAAAVSWDAVEAPSEAEADVLPDWFTYLQKNDFTATEWLDEFSGDTVITRATSTPFLARYGFLNKLSEKTTVEDCTFPDVNSKSEELQKTIIVSCAYDLLRWSNGNFIPDRTLTKDELLTVLVRTKTWFLDETATPWFKNYFDRAVSNGLVDDTTSINEFSGPVTKTNIGEWLYRLSLVD